MSRRGRGEGSVTLQKNGLWQARVSCGKDHNGQRIVKVAYDRNKKAAVRKLHELRQRYLTGEVEPSKDTLSVFAARWLTHVSEHVRATTLSSYALIINTYVGRDSIASLPLGKITSMHVEEFLARLRAGGKGDRTLQLTYVVLKMALQQALGWSLLTVHPMTDGKVRSPKYKAEKRPVWSREDSGRFLAAARGDRLYALYLLALSTTIRQGELLGLQWSDLELDEGRANIAHNLTEVNGVLQPLGEPKTEAGKRTVPLSPPAVAALRERRAASLAEGTAASTYVFPDTKGGPMHKGHLYKSYRPLLAKAEVPKIHFHDLRHTAATLLRAGGLDLKVLQGLLGHSQFSLTADTYGHVLPHEQLEIRAGQAKLWGSLT